MDSTLQLQELNSICQEYKEYFTTISIVSKEINYLLVETDGKQFQVMVDVSGWYTPESKIHYPTFESLMMVISPGFGSRFNQELSGKLEQLLHERNE